MQRRSFLKGAASVAAVAAVAPSVAMAEAPKGKNDMNYKTAVDSITGGKAPVKSSKIKLKAPEIAENGAVVPVKITVDSPMTDANYVKAIHVLASQNSNVRCANIFLTPANGKAVFGTRIKLGKSQDVVALAELSDGSFIMAAQNVKVTIGGCG